MEDVICDEKASLMQLEKVASSHSSELSLRPEESLEEYIQKLMAVKLNEQKEEATLRPRKRELVGKLATYFT